MAISTYLSIITLRVNGVNSPKDIEWWDGLKKKTQEAHFSVKTCTD